MSLDFIFRNARIAGQESETRDIGIKNGRFAAIEVSIAAEAPQLDLDGQLVTAGLCETHIHLDKSCLLGRCACDKGTLQEAVAAVAGAKASFTQEDVYARAARTLEKAIAQGTQRMRTHVEVDPRVGLTSLKALQRLKRDYAWAIDLRLCVFPQEGLLDDPGCDAVLVEALESGADAVGGAPYMDTDSHGQIARIFELARRYDLDVDFHLDFNLDPSHLDLLEVCRMADETHYGGRVAIGHVTKLSAVPEPRLMELGRRLAGAGVAVTALPATDLFLLGRDHDHNVPRGVAQVHKLLALGVTCSLSTNNVLNPFTPFGDCSTVRIANLYANVAQVGTPAGMADCLDMVSAGSARLMNLDDYGIRVGNSADLVVLASESRAGAVAEIAPVLFAIKGGRRTVTRPAPHIHRPA